VGGIESISTGAAANQDDLYRDAAELYGSALERLVSAYEADPEKRRDLSQDIHFQLWRSFQRYDARCSLRTWVYRVAHHVAASHVLRERKIFSSLVSLEQLETLPDKEQSQFAGGQIEPGQIEMDQRRNLERLSVLIQRLKPLDRQVIVGYLEDLDAASIGEITGLSPGNVAVRIHRIKNILARRFHQGKISQRSHQL
jgi:RNA polymerase sigma-70 factor, ECF subfamily